MVRFVLHAAMVVALTSLTQLGGVAWIVALGYRRGRWGFWAAFVLGYGLLLGAAQIAAPLAGRVALPCGGQPLRMQSAFYCVTMRNFVSVEMGDVALAAAGRVAVAFPGTVTLALDGNFPLGGGFPMLPHLGHGDGDKLDLAFFYSDAGVYAAGRTASPIGYFAFERVGEEVCPAVWPTLRWDMGWFQPLVRDLEMEPDRTAALIGGLVSDARVGKVFVEPPLAARLGVAGAKVRFQGCRAARHDDHVHVQL